MTATPEVKKLLIPLADITVDPALQVRGAVDAEKVLEYEKIIRENGPMDRLVLFFENPTIEGAKPAMFLADGFHRKEASHKAGLFEVPCELREGTRSDALLFAMRRNGHHGATMTNAQKRHAAGLAVLDATIGLMTDAAIAQHIGCSPSLVGDARRGETPAQKSEKRERRKSEPQSTPAPARGKQETESPAPPSARARERKPAEPPPPNKKKILREIQEYLTAEVLEESDLCGIMEGKIFEYREVPKAGSKVRLRVVGKSGREQVSVEVFVKALGVNELLVKLEDKKIGILEA